MLCAQSTAGDGEPVTEYVRLPFVVVALLKIGGEGFRLLRGLKFAVAVVAAWIFH
jgi:hypothetical protein